MYHSTLGLRVINKKHHVWLGAFGAIARIFKPSPKKPNEWTTETPRKLYLILLDISCKLGVIRLGEGDTSASSFLV